MKWEQNRSTRTDGLMDSHVETNISFSQFCKCGEDFGLCLCLCGICNKAYFVSARAQALLGFWIQWVQVKGVLHYVGGGVKLCCGPIWEKQGQKNIGTRVVREWSQKLLVAACLIHHQWTCSWLKIHIFQFHEFGPLKEHFCMKCFNTDVQVQLYSCVWSSWLKRGSYCQDVYNAITRWDKYHNGQGYFVVECMDVFLHSWN
jgi:hypothetical protein